MLLSGASPSAKGQLSNKDFLVGGLVVVLSAAISYVLSVIPQISLPTQWVWVVPIVTLVLQTAEKLLKDNTNS